MDKEKVTEIIEETVQTMNFIPVEIHVSQSRNRHTIKVVIYHPDTDVSSADCARISGVLSRRLDVEDLIEHAYHLVVESPGVDRKLITPKEYSIFKGKQVAVYLNHPKDYNVKGDFMLGTLTGLSEDENSILIEQKKKVFSIPFADFNRCNLYFDIKKYLKSGGR